MAKIAVLGYGTVGSGVVEVLMTNQKSIEHKAEQPIEIKYVLDLREFPGSPIEDVLVHDYETILEDDEVEIIAEVMGGLEPAYTFVKKALERGKSCVTSNKELVAKYGPELLALAKTNKVNFLFEASVGGGIPIIRPLNHSLTADEIYEITGILNGTTNFILTKMKQEGLDFDTVLKEAQELGYAERNPEADVEGHDACRKIAILSSLAFGRHVDFEEIYTEGISKISDRDMTYAKALNMDIKLLGKSKLIDNEVYSVVAPLLLAQDHPLSNVHGVFNAILVKGNVIGDVMFYGAGAGKLPTASAVVADVIDAAKHKGKNIIIKWSEKQKKILPVTDVKTKAFIRLATKDVTEAKATITAVFGQVDYIEAGYEDEVGFVTDFIKEGELRAILDRLADEAGIREVLNMIRIEG